jgi:uncharacterized protein involved in outer membrane biogenesis
MSVNAVRRTVAAVIVLIALALLVPPFINVNRYKARMAASLSNAVGRPVRIGDVEMRLIPQPGFIMHNVEIDDDASISNEPILHAEQVTADLRLSSLWRGRLEIAKLTLQYPSLNVVRNGGQWNLESLLWRASRTPVAPTGQRHAETRVRFPYIEVEQGRVNFKNGLEKHVFAFTEADFALFSPAEGQWRMRLEARPVRTDTSISDTGTVKADIGFKKAEMLRDTVVNGKISWQRGQLGMITKLINGRDSGWRGMLELQSEISGTPDDLHFTTAAVVHDFRRFDIYAGDPLAISGTCQGIASIPSNAIRGFRCEVPTSPGALIVVGNIGDRLKRYEISVAAENLGANSLVNVIRHVKKDIPADLAATGTLNMSAVFKKTDTDGESRTWSGRGSATELTLRSAVLKDPIALKPLNFELRTPAELKTPEQVATVAPKSKSKDKKPEAPSMPGQFLTVAPFAIPLGGKAPTILDARIGTGGFQLGMTGPAELEHVIGLARSVGISVPKIRLRGDVMMSIEVSGAWKGLRQPNVNGTARVTNGRAEVPGIAQEILVSQSDVALTGNEFQLLGMQAEVGSLKFTGSATLPRHCEADSPCGPGLDLQFDDLDLAQLNAMLNPNLKKQPWYKLFGSSQEESLLTKIYAVGRVTAKRILVEKLVGTKFYADFRLNKGDLLVSNLRALVLGGSHEGQWQADFTGPTPVYSGTGTATRVNAALLASVGKAAVGTGTISGRYQWKMSGWNASDFVKSAEGSASFDWSAATIRAFALNGRGPAKVNDFSGKLAYKDGVLSFDESRMTTNNGIYFVTGTAEPEKLALELKSDTNAGYKVTGSWKAPEVATTAGPGDVPKTKAEAVIPR